MSDNNNSTGGGIGFCGLLTIAFIVLKLCKVIAWGWLWVLSPLWIPAALVIAGLIVYVLYQVLHKRPDEKRRLKAGMNEYGWKQFKKNKSTSYIEPQSKWEQKIKEVQRNKND